MSPATVRQSTTDPSAQRSAALWPAVTRRPIQRSSTSHPYIPFWPTPPTHHSPLHHTLPLLPLPSPSHPPPPALVLSTTRPQPHHTCPWYPFRPVVPPAITLATPFPSHSRYHPPFFSLHLLTSARAGAGAGNRTENCDPKWVLKQRLGLGQKSTAFSALLEPPKVPLGDGPQVQGLYTFPI